MKKRKKRIAVLMATIFVAFVVIKSRADTVADDLAAIQNYGILVNNIQTITVNSGGVVNGNIGLGSSSSPQFNINGGQVNGQVQSGGSFNSNNQNNGGSVSLGYSANNTVAATANSAVSDLANQLAPDQSVGSLLPVSLSSGQTETVNASAGTYVSSQGVNVFDVNEFNFTGGNLTFVGTETQTVILIINSENVEVGGNVQVSGGLLPSNVILDLVTAGNEFQTLNGASISAAVLDMYLASGGNVNGPVGQILVGGGGGTLSVNGGGTVNSPRVSMVPEAGNFFAVALVFFLAVIFRAIAHYRVK